MSRETIFEAWAPQGGAWMPWAKAILFAHTDDVDVVSATPAAPPTWIHEGLLDVPQPAVDYRTRAPPARPAIVVDLPGAEGVAAGLALADLGFRPVPLYTALPSYAAVVPMREVMDALVLGAPALAQRKLPLDAPPAFLLDARRGGNAPPIATPGAFDNRSIVFPTDFPSSERLLRAGLRGCLLLQSGPATPSEDLMPTLVDWQSAGLPIRVAHADGGHSSLIHVRPPGPLARLAMWLTRAELRIVLGDSEGGFGKRIPVPRQGG